MSLFTSKRERKLWILLLLVLMAIYATLAFGEPLSGVVRDSSLLTAGFFLCLIMMAATSVTHGLRVKPRGAEVAVWLGISAVYLLLFLRIAAGAERSHLFEYSVVAVLMHMVLVERKNNGRRVPVPALFAILGTCILGFIDEALQALVPSRVYDIRDVVFNVIAATAAISGAVVLAWVRKRFGRSR